MLTQDMYCIETLARVDTLCLDKTGTLTDGNLNVLKVVSTSDISEKDLAKIIKTLVDATKDENATARAIKKEFENLNNFDSYSASVLDVCHSCHLSSFCDERDLS